MIDERREELAALYALDLLEEGEHAAFEAELAIDPALGKLVREFRASAIALTHAAPGANPPASLRARVLASAAAPRSASGVSNILSFRTLAPWAAAACFAGLAAWLGEHYLASQSEASLLHDQVAAAELAIRSAQNENDAAQIVARHQLDQLNRQVTETSRQLAAADQRATAAESRLADSALQLADAQKKLAVSTQQIAQLNQRLEASVRLADDTHRRSRELDQALSAAQAQVVALQRDLQAQGDLANFTITTLASLLKNTPQALAVAVWNPTKQEGVLKVDKLPALAANQDYQLWVVDPQYANPVDGGVFTVDPQSGAARVKFTGKQPVAAISAFAVTLERKGGVPKAEGPFVLLGK